MIKALLALIILSFVGIVAFFYLTGSTTLTERTFIIDGQKYSVLVPKIAKESKTEPTVVAFSRGGKKIAGVMVSRMPEPKRPYSDNCKDLRKTVIFTINLVQVNKQVDVCEDPLGLYEGKPEEAKDFKLLGTSGFKTKPDDSKDTLIQVTVKESYLRTNEDEAKIKQILESFKALN